MMKLKRTFKNSNKAIVMLKTGNSLHLHLLFFVVRDDCVLILLFFFTVLDIHCMWLKIGKPLKKRRKSQTLSSTHTMHLIWIFDFRFSNVWTKIWIFLCVCMKTEDNRMWWVTCQLQIWCERITTHTNTNTKTNHSCVANGLRLLLRSFVFLFPKSISHPLIRALTVHLQHFLRLQRITRTLLQMIQTNKMWKMTQHTNWRGLPETMKRNIHCHCHQVLPLLWTTQNKIRFGFSKTLAHSHWKRRTKKKRKRTQRNPINFKNRKKNQNWYWLVI